MCSSSATHLLRPSLLGRSMFELGAFSRYSMLGNRYIRKSVAGVEHSRHPRHRSSVFQRLSAARAISRVIVVRAFFGRRHLPASERPCVTSYFYRLFAHVIFGGSSRFHVRRRDSISNVFRPRRCTSLRIYIHTSIRVCP